MEEQPEVSTPVKQFPCSICSRTFRQEALERHENFCKKSKEKKRKAFDSSKQRAEGTEINTIPKPKIKEVKTKVVVAKEKPKSNWRAKHEEFIRAIRAAKGVPGENGDDGENDTSKPAAIPVGYIQCPTCGRNFSERAADRHLPWCKDKKNRSIKSPNSANDASDRLKARTKYRAPLPLKKDSMSAKSEKKKIFAGTPSPKKSTPEPPTPPEPKKTANNNRNVGSSKPPSNQSDSNNNVKNNKKIAPGLDKKKNNIPKKVSAPRKALVTKTEPLPTSRHNIMKFKEKFPNHKHRNLMTDENYDGFQDDLRELLRQNTVFSRAPKTVPGVRTGGQTVKGNQKPNRTSEEEEILNLHNRFEEMGTNFKNGNGEFDVNWAKKLSTWNMNNSGDGLPQIGSSENNNGKIDPWAPIVQDTVDTRVSTGNSSSGSDSTLPPISRGSSGSEGGGRLPRFCHQCGTKYPVNGAKYCCECGARRLANGAAPTEIIERLVI